MNYDMEKYGLGVNVANNKHYLKMRTSIISCLLGNVSWFLLFLPHCESYSWRGVGVS